jgi:threonine synthase
LAQVVYYFTSAVSLGSPHRKVNFTVPTGNFGDVFAGYVARRMGLPIDRLIVATNQNDILHRTLATGEYRKDGVVPSMSPSMDIQVSSNFERALFDVYDRQGSAVQQLMDEMTNNGAFTLSQGALERLQLEFDSGRASEEGTLAAIGATYKLTGQVICPHTAIGVKVAAEKRMSKTIPMVTLATAHAAKFPDAVFEGCGVNPTLPSRMADLYDRPERVTRVANNLDDLKSMILSKVRT